MLREMYYWMIFHLKKIKTNDMPQFNAYLLICVLVNANLLTLVMITNYLLNFNLTIFSEDSKYIGLVGGLSLMIFNYFYLFRYRKKIIEKYDQLPQKRRVIGITSFWIYSILSLSLLFIVGMNS
jgi:hypothetical protein